MKFVLALLFAATPAFAAQFSDYAVVPTAVANNQIPKLRGADYKKFRSHADALVKSFKQGHESALAGHILFTSFGCGTECMVLLGVNLLNGDVKLFDNSGVFSFDFAENSRLLIINKGGVEGGMMNYPEEQYVVDENMNLSKIQ